MQEGTLETVGKILMFTELPIVAGPCSAQKRIVFPQMCEFCMIILFSHTVQFFYPHPHPQQNLGTAAHVNSCVHNVTN